MPLGVIKDANPKQDAIDVYALVLNNVVVNTILASYNEILSISATYDYSIDCTMQGTQAGIGWTYNGGTDKFTQPPAPPINWVATVQSDFDGVIDSIQQVINDSGSGGGNLTVDQLQTAYNSCLNDNPNLDNATLTLMAAVYQYVLSGG